jgi:hypothetical protein
MVHSAEVLAVAQPGQVGGNLAGKVPSATILGAGRMMTRDAWSNLWTARIDNRYFL